MISLKKNYGTCSIVFNKTGADTFNQAQKRIECTKETTPKISQDEFFKCPVNKNNFTKMLVDAMTEAVIQYFLVDNLPAFISNLCQEPVSGNIAVISSNIDVLVVLLACSRVRTKYFFIRSTKTDVLYDIELMKTTLPTYFTNNILLINAFVGCATTSAPFRK